MFFQKPNEKSGNSGTKRPCVGCQSDDQIHLSTRCTATHARTRAHTTAKRMRSTISSTIHCPTPTAALYVAQSLRRSDSVRYVTPPTASNSESLALSHQSRPARTHARALLARLQNATGRRRELHDAGVGDVVAAAAAARRRRPRRVDVASRVPPGERLCRTFAVSAVRCPAMTTTAGGAGGGVTLSPNGRRCCVARHTR